MPAGRGGGKLRLPSSPVGSGCIPRALALTVLASGFDRCIALRRRAREAVAPCRWFAYRTRRWNGSRVGRNRPAAAGVGYRQSAGGGGEEPGAPRRRVACVLFAGNGIETGARPRGVVVRRILPAASRDALQSRRAGAARRDAPADGRAHEGRCGAGKPRGLRERRAPLAGSIAPRPNGTGTGRIYSERVAARHMGTIGPGGSLGQGLDERPQSQLYRVSGCDARRRKGRGFRSSRREPSGLSLSRERRRSRHAGPERSIPIPPVLLLAICNRVEA